MYEHGSAPSFRSCALRAAPSFSYANCAVICYKKKTALSFRYVNWTAGLTCSIAINYV